LYKEAKKKFPAIVAVKKLTAFFTRKADNYQENKNDIAALAVVTNTVMNLDNL
jgi:hypothetical protein